MKKFFTLTLALMATITLWAQEFTFTGSTLPSGWSGTSLGSTSFSDDTPVLKVSSSGTLTYTFESPVNLTSIDFVYSFGSKDANKSVTVTAKNTSGTALGSETLSQETKQSGSNVRQEKSLTYAYDGVKTIFIENISDKNFLLRYVKFNAASITITIDPNGGSYASTPDGWTFNEGVYTKTVGEGDFSAPEGITNEGYTLDGWKDNHNNVITFPITIDKDTILIAQWGAATCPEGLSISGDDEYSERTDIELTASLTEGNGEITYNWYKGADLAAAKAAGSIGTGTTYSKASCAKSDAGNYFCVATKADCSEAASTAFEVIVTDYVCPTSGTLFSMEITSTAGKVDIPAGTTVDLSLYGTVEGGSASFTNSDSQTDKALINHVAQTICFNGNKAYVTLNLDCPLKTGDKLTFVSGSGSNQICFTTNTTRSTSIISASNAWDVPEEFNDVSTIYIWRNSGATYVRSLTITRPSTPTAVENAQEEAAAVKFIKDGQIFIEKNGHVYNVLGGCVK